MKLRYILLSTATALFFLGGCHMDKVHQYTGTDTEGTEEVSADQEQEVVGNYGAEITIDNAIPANQVMAKLGNAESMDLKVEGVIREVCQMRGCWMTMDIGNGETMRITFKDYGFFVPKNSAGFKAVIEGSFSKQMVDVETLKHHAEEAGKSEEEIAEITEPQEELAFEAVGVVITGPAG